MGISTKDYEAMLGRVNALPGEPPFRATTVVREKKMNKTEAEYFQYLGGLQRLGEVRHFAFEAVTLKLGDDCRLTPDFLVIDAAGRVVLDDVKGFWKKQGKAHVEDDARVKLAVAASTVFPFFIFRIVWKQDGTWHTKTL